MVCTQPPVKLLTSLPGQCLAQSVDGVQGLPEGWTRACYPIASPISALLSAATLQESHVAKCEVSLVSRMATHATITARTGDQQLAGGSHSFEILWGTVHVSPHYHAVACRATDGGFWAMLCLSLSDSGSGRLYQSHTPTNMCLAQATPPCPPMTKVQRVAHACLLHM